MYCLFCLEKGEYPNHCIDGGRLGTAAFTHNFSPDFLLNSMDRCLLRHLTSLGSPGKTGSLVQCRDPRRFPYLELSVVKTRPPGCLYFSLDQARGSHLSFQVLVIFDALDILFRPLHQSLWMITATQDDQIKNLPAHMHHNCFSYQGTHIPVYHLVPGQ